MAESGWYADPTARHGLRWFDGQAWTDHVADDGVAAVDVSTGDQGLESVTVDHPRASPAHVLEPRAAAPTPTVGGEDIASVDAGDPGAALVNFADEVDDRPTLMFIGSVGVVAFVWSQLLVGFVVNDAYWDRYGDSVATYGALLVAGCGVAAATMWPSGRRRVLLTAPLAAILTYVAMSLGGDPEYWVLVIGLGVGVAVGATWFSVGFATLATGVAWWMGQFWGWGGRTGLVPLWLGGDERTYASGTALATTLGPALVGASAAAGVYLSQRSRPNSAAPAWLMQKPASGLALEISAPVVVPAPSEEVVSFLVRQLVSAGAMVTSQSPTSIAGHVVTKKSPSILVAILLWFICIIPMVIYLVNRSKDVQEPFSLTFSPDAAGTRVEVGGIGRGLAAATWALSEAASRWAPPGASLAHAR